MRRITLILAMSMILLSSAVFAGVPGLINYQGTLVDGGGVALDTTVAIAFSIYSDSTGGSMIWSESQPTVSVNGGLFNVLLGSANALPERLFDEPSRWLGIQVGGDPEMTPRQRIASVGYAFRAARADSADYASNSGGGGDDGDWTISGDDIYSAIPGNVGIGTTGPVAALHVSSTATQRLLRVDDAGAGDGTPFVIDQDGNVGVNFQSYGNPQTRLHVMGPGGWTGDNELLRLELAGTYGGTKFIQYANDTTYDWGLKLEDTNGNNRLTINHNTGNVGLGTSSPTEKLHVVGNAIVESSMGVGTSGLDAALHVSASAAQRLFRVDDAGEGDGTPFVIDQDGNVGVNFQSYGDPQTRLHVMGPGGWTGDNELLRLELAGTYGGTKFIQYADDITYDWGLKLEDTNGNNRLTISHNTGNVGVGASEPQQRLHVNGTVQMTGFKMPTGAAAGRVLTSDATGVGSWQAAGADGDWIVAGSDMYSAVAGDVGVGTSSPQGPLHVDVSGSATDLYNAGQALTIANTDATTGNVASLLFLHSNDGVSGRGAALMAQYASRSLGFESVDLNFITKHAGTLSSKMLIQSDGDVGVGTTIPQGPLHVDVSGSATDLYNAGQALAVANTDATTNNVASLLFLHSADGVSGRGAALMAQFTNRSAGSESVDLNFITKNIGTLTTKMVLQSDGNVGIGTTSPQRLLHLVGANPRILIEASSSSPELNFKNSDDTGLETWALYKHGTNDDLHFYQGGNKVTIQNSTGNVGIGTSSPARKLHVNDVMRLEPRTTSPSSPSPGDMYIDSSDSNKLKVWDGTMWRACW